MKQYWPVAVVLDNGKAISLSTYNSFSSIVEAEKQFKLWQDDYGYVLLCTWVHDENDSIVSLGCYVDIVGQVTKL